MTQQANLVNRTLKVRIKDRHTPLLRQWAAEVNQVWNWANEVSHKAATPYVGPRRFLSGFDLNNLAVGATKGEAAFAIPSATIQQVCEKLATRRRQFKRTKLNWRVSNPKSARRSLGWIPFKVRQLKLKNGLLRFNGVDFKVWDSWGLDGYELRSGSFSEDARGRWYLNICVQVGAVPLGGTEAVGVDLGLKETAVCSNGKRLIGRHYRKSEQQLAKAQRAKNKRRTRAIHAKIKNQRKDALHKFSTGLVRTSGAIFVGNVSSAKLVKTTMAKSTLDASWSMLKTMLDYKCRRAGVVFEVVDESFTSQTCSECGCLPASRPRGIAGLGIREWACDDCGTVHDRDVNAAKNILAAGHRRLAVGILGL